MATPEKGKQERTRQEGPATASASRPETPRLAAIAIRGLIKLHPDLRKTMRLLHLHHTNRCVVYQGTPAIKGMLHKVKDYITWGEISEEMFQMLVQKRGRPFLGRLMDRGQRYSYHALDIDGKKYLPYFSLHPPRKGFERKGVKVSFKTGGALGYRGKAINELLQKML